MLAFQKGPWLRSRFRYIYIYIYTLLKKRKVQLVKFTLRLQKITLTKVTSSIYIYIYVCAWPRVWCLGAWRFLADGAIFWKQEWCRVAYIYIHSFGKKLKVHSVKATFRLQKMTSTKDPFLLYKCMRMTSFWMVGGLIHFSKRKVNLVRITFLIQKGTLTKATSSIYVYSFFSNEKFT